MRYFRKSGDVRVDVEAHGGLGMPEPPSQFDSLHAGLMPQSSPTVPEAVGAEAEGAHRVTHLVASRNAEWKRRLERGDKEAWGVDDAAKPLPLSEFSPQPYSASDRVYVGHGKGECFRYTRTQLLHDDDGKPKVRLDTFQKRGHLILVGWIGLDPHYAWQLHLPVAGDVGDVSEVQHHAEITDEQTDGTGLVLGGEGADIRDDVADADLVDGPVTESIHERWGTEPVAVYGAVADAPTGRDPFSVDVAEARTTLDAAIKLYLRVLGASEPITYQMHAYYSFPAGPKGPTVLDFRVSASPTVADVEPAAIPSVPRTDVKGGHQ